jgi:membrane protein
MVLDPVTAEQQLTTLSSLPPPLAFGLIEERCINSPRKGNGGLSLHLLVSFGLTFWSSATGKQSVLSAVNVAYDETEQRPFLHLQVIVVSMPLIAVLCAILANCILLLLPLAIGFPGPQETGQ